MWTRQKTVIAGHICRDDWTIQYRRIAVGRVTLMRLTNPERDIWRWSSWAHPARQGESATLNEALEACRHAVLDSSGRLATGAWIWRDGDQKNDDL